jgi:hypothetical protein
VRYAPFSHKSPRISTLGEKLVRVNGHQGTFFRLHKDLAQTDNASEMPKKHAKSAL